MRILRVVFIVATFSAVVASPLVFQAGPTTPSLLNAYAASTERSADTALAPAASNGNSNQNNNNNHNNNDNSKGGGNDNFKCYPDLNSNDNVPCIFNHNGNRNDNHRGFQGGGGNRVGDSRTGTTKCFSVQEVGQIQRALGDGDVTVSVPPDAGMIQVTRLTLHSLGASEVPAPSGGTFQGTLIFRIDAQDGCNGLPIAQLSAPVNLGVSWRILADKSKAQIVYLQNGAWTNVTTVPDPAATNPYISATIDKAGVYAVLFKP